MDQIGIDSWFSFLQAQIRGVNLTFDSLFSLWQAQIRGVNQNSETPLWLKNSQFKGWEFCLQIRDSCTPFGKFPTLYRFLDLKASLKVAGKIAENFGKSGHPNTHPRNHSWSLPLYLRKEERVSLECPAAVMFALPSHTKRQGKIKTKI